MSLGSRPPQYDRGQVFSESSSDKHHHEQRQRVKLPVKAWKAAKIRDRPTGEVAYSPRVVKVTTL